MIQVYFMEVTPLKSQTLYEKAMGYIDADRKKQVLSIKSEKNRLLSLGAGLLLTYALIETQNTFLNNEYSEDRLKVEFTLDKLEKKAGLRDADEILPSINNMKIVKAPSGKPYIQNHRELFFNLSHSGEYVLLAIASQEVGADIQIHRSVVKGLAKKILNEGEIASNKETAFSDEELISLWTVKEACSKCSGEGISKDFTTLFVDFKDDKVIDTTSGLVYRIKRVCIDSRYEAYVCWGD